MKIFMFYLNRPGAKLPRQSVADVQQALYLLIATRKGEIPYQPDYGLSLVYDVLGAIEDEKEAIEQEVAQAISEFEPRIEVVSVSASKVASASGRGIKLEVGFLFETVANLFSTNIPLNG